MGRYTIHVAGESFRNLDGSSRQEELARCRVGEMAVLERDPYNPHDSNCIKVVSARGVQVGNVGRENAEWIAARMDKGGDVSATIESVGVGDTGLLGAVLSVSTEAQDPLPSPAPPPSSRAQRVKMPALAKVGLGMVALLAIAALLRSEPGPPATDPPRESANPEYYAEAAIDRAGMRCGGVLIAERLASGDMVAECRDGQSYRIAGIGSGRISVQRCTAAEPCE
jgi:hypothetical protein